jgi:predicted DNA-binding transcriptional regulator YafY
METIIIKAIHEKKLIESQYQERHRVAEPHVYGITNGIKQILGYQIRGQSRNGNLPDWRKFDLDKIIGLRILDESFPGRRPYPSGKHSSFDLIIAKVD